jgi:16S rRNA (adenine1518-N6/adenine1519-N6)-dimethyltransferase
MVQKEVADRLAAKPGSKIYGTPSVKLAWYGTAKSVGNIGRNVFWPAPNVDSALVRFERHAADDPRNPNNRSVGRDLVFRLIDASFAQRRKTLHAALRKIVPSGAFERAGIDPTRRGETLDIDEFVALATACKELEA